MRKHKTRGVTYEDVRAVVDDMVANGADVNEISVRDIRDVLGTGSFSTIADHRDACRDDIIYASKGAGALMEEHVTAVATMMGDIVARATFDIKRGAEAEVAAARTEAHRSQRELAEAREITADLEGELDKARAEAAKAGVTITDQRAVISRLEGKIDGLQQLLDRFSPHSLAVSANDEAGTPAPRNVSLPDIEPSEPVEIAVDFDAGAGSASQGGRDDQLKSDTRDAAADGRPAGDEASTGDDHVPRAV
jgi:hypothetical protein